MPKKSTTMGKVKKAAKTTDIILQVSASMARRNARKFEAEQNGSGTYGFRSSSSDADVLQRVGKADILDPDDPFYCLCDHLF